MKSLERQVDETGAAAGAHGESGGGDQSPITNHQSRLVREAPIALIELKALGKTYHSGEVPVEVLKGVSLQIHEGEFVALMGQSGSGKTTLMNILGCLDRPSTGQYLFAGRDVSRLEPDDLALLRRDTFGFVFQRYNLLANSTALENVVIPAVYAGVPHEDRVARAADLLATLGLADRSDHRPTQLSGGQQQRVSIARALMNGGRVILADEPTGALDSRSGAEVMGLLHDLHRQGPHHHSHHTRCERRRGSGPGNPDQGRADRL